MILFSIVIPVLLWGFLENPLVWMALTVTVGYGAIGFYDDYRKLTRQSSAGLAGRMKLVWQFLIASAVVATLIYGPYGFETTLAFPFARYDLYHLDLPRWLFLLFAVVVIVGASNAVNLTDGLDGLAIVPVTVSSGTFLILAYAAGATIAIKFGGELVRFDFAEYLLLPKVAGAEELAVFAGAMVGAGLAFLWFNAYPAQVFMGDVGSLSLGGALGTLAVCTKNELLLVIVGGVFVMEAISVILQVGSYKLRKKRVFRMAPIHHHFELMGWPEPKVIVRFWIISVILSLVALSSLKLR